MTHPTARISDVALITGNKVHMQVVDGLAGRFADVYSDVVAVRPMLFLDLALGRFECCDQRLLLLLGCIKPARDVSARDQQCVAGADRVAVPQADDELGLVEKELRVRAAEGAVGFHGQILSAKTSGSAPGGISYRNSG